MLMTTQKKNIYSFKKNRLSRFSDNRMAAYYCIFVIVTRFPINRVLALIFKLNALIALIVLMELIARGICNRCPEPLNPSKHLSMGFELLWKLGYVNWEKNLEYELGLAKSLTFILAI